MRCHHCDLAFEEGLLCTTISGDQHPFCDSSCQRAYVRERTQESIEEKHDYYSTHEVEGQFKASINKSIFASSMFYLSLLQRRRRSHLIKLDELMKKCNCAVIEEAMEAKRDDLVYHFGEIFKENNSTIIDAWAAPE